MLQPLDVVRDTVDVDHSQFLLASWMGGYATPPGWPSWDDTAQQADMDNWFAATANRAIVISGAGFHKAQASMELWDCEPPGGEERWARSRTARFFSSSGFACLDEVCGRVWCPFLDLRLENWEWWVRAQVRPGENPSSPVDMLPEGVEEWRFQFWPVNTPEPPLDQLAKRPLP